MSSDNRIIIFDTTLRDGEQALPQRHSARQKLQIALALEELGVDVLEAGFLTLPRVTLKEFPRLKPH